MTWHSRTCFNALAFLAALPVAAATVAGSVTLSDSKDAAVRKKDYSGVVVWLEPTGPMREAVPASARALMNQKDKTFVPHVLAIRNGTQVDFPNSDPIFHNAFSNYNGKTFDVGLYPPGFTRTVRFNSPGIVRVFCNIHAAMSAVIVVLDTPYFATSKKDGTFRIENVPSGEYTLHVFHERSPQSTLDRLARPVTVGDSVTLPPLSISESGYIAIPHPNKYGRDYQPEPSGGALYPAHH